MAAPSLVDQLPVLADPVRGRLLLLLERRELAVGDLAQGLQVPQPTVSRHLRMLLDGGWVTSRAEGTSRLYRADPEAMAAGQAELWRLVRAEVAAGPQARRDAERMRQVLARSRSRGGFFAGAAGRWDSLRGELFGGRLELLPLLGLLPPDAVVGDLGCGTGHFLLAAAPFVRRVVGVDGTPEMLEVARTRLAGVRNVELREGELESLPVARGELDLAVLALALSYVDDPARAVAEAARVLRRGGRLLVVDVRPHDRVEYRQTLGHRWQGFGERQVQGWFAAAGLEGRWRPVPPDPAAKGPLLFVADAVKGRGSRVKGPRPRARTDA
jgi:ArsR family transcriptional regulator